MAALFGLGAAGAGGGFGIGSIVSAVATIGGMAMQLASANAAAAAQKAAGQAAKQSADFEAAQLDIRAKEEQAAAQRESEQIRRRRDLALSSLTARSAASGFSATDPTTLSIGDEITRYGTTQEQMAMYGGASRRAGVESQAAGRRFEGEAALRGANLSASARRYDAAGTILGGVSNLALRFGNRPTSTASSYYG